MTAAQCRDQARCPVGDPGALRSVRTLSIDAGEIWHNVGSVEHDDIFNSSGKGNGRFSPLRSGGNGEPLPHLYLARNPIGALLETVLHGFTAANREVVAGRDLVGRTLRSVELPERLLVADLRDQELERLGIDRRSLVSSSSEHYRCTQEWAYRIRSLKPGGRSLAGIVWNSRVAEIVSTVAAPTTRALLVPPLTEVCVVYGDRTTAPPTRWGSEVTRSDLMVGPGLELVLDLVVQQLDGFVTGAIG